MMVRAVYICEGCDKSYEELEEAQRCERQDPGQGLVQVGDIVRAKGGFGSFDGDKRWVIQPTVGLFAYRDGKCPLNDTNCFAECCTYSFYYVVTAIDIYQHRMRYHLTTRAMKKGYRGGYTFNRHHHTPVRVESPSDFLVRSGRGLIGQTWEWLL